jgi:DNA (cytosine-5)-methyltransferase 1
MSSYPDTLAELWRQHQAPRTADAPTLVSLFSGCGGSSLGYSAAGYRELLSVEWNAKACQVFAANFPGVLVRKGDVTELDPAELDVPPGGMDLLACSPPCQGLSVTGLRRAADPRNELWREVVRLAAGWQPRCVVIENVPGLVKGEMRAVFHAICGGLRDIGYQVGARLLDAQFLGTPQRRQRVIIIASQTPLDVPERDVRAFPAFPVPTGRPLSVRDAWEGLIDPGEFWLPSGASAVLAPLVEPGSAGDNAMTARGGKPTRWNLKRLAWDRPSNTIPREVRKDGGSLLHPAENRMVGTRELARLQGFPDEFSWLDLPYADVHHLIGNSVPPPMARAIGRALLDAFRGGRAETPGPP